MKQLVFSIGSNICKIIINGRKIIVQSDASNFAKIAIDLNDEQMLDRLTNTLPNLKEVIKICKRLKTESDMSNDLKADFQAQGWRLIRKS